VLLQDDRAMRAI